jgi:lipopolysaccharide biosynthesis protein
MIEKVPSPKLTSKQMQIVRTSRHYDTCVILHLYYPDMWAEIQSYLLNLEDKFDLYVTLPYGVQISDEEIRVKYPEVHIFHCENRGRDIAPFLMVFLIISKLNYKYICKIHTKKSPHIINGSEWHQDALSKLLGSKEIVLQIKRSFDEHADWGLIAPSGHVVPSSYFWYQNSENVIRLANSINIPTNEINFSFVAGSMFWLNPQAFQLLLNMDISVMDFDLEYGQQDGTLAHAFERFFGMLLTYAGYKIAESDKQEVRLAEISFQFRLLLQEFQKQEREIGLFRAYQARNERRLRKIFGSKIWDMVKILRWFRSSGNKSL